MVPAFNQFFLVKIENEWKILSDIFHSLFVGCVSSHYFCHKLTISKLTHRSINGASEFDFSYFLRISNLTHPTATPKTNNPINPPPLNGKPQCTFFPFDKSQGRYRLLVVGGAGL